MSDDQDSQLDEISSGEFAFVQVTPDDFRILHDVTDNSPFVMQPQMTAPQEAGQDIESGTKSSGTLNPFPHAATFSEGMGLESLPIRNTFIHIESPGTTKAEANKEWVSAPGMIMTTEFHLKYPAMEQAHIRGECRPCAYYVRKEDGCRWGEQCNFCHLCTPEARKRKKREKVKALKERDYMAKLNSMQTATGYDTDRSAT